MGWGVTVPAVLQPDPSFLLRSPLPSALGRCRRGGGRMRCCLPSSGVGAVPQSSRRWARLMEWLSRNPSVAIGIPWVVTTRAATSVPSCVFACVSQLVTSGTCNILSGVTHLMT